MKRAIINPAKCNNCKPCRVELECLHHAVIQETLDDKPWIDFYLCVGCMKCKGFCPNRAIEEIAQPCNGNRRSGW